MPSLADLEQWMEEQLPPNLHELPMKVTTTIQSYSAHLYSQLSDMTPTYSQIESTIESSLHNIPFVGGTSCQPRAPPPPPPVSMLETVLKRADTVTGSRTRTSMAAAVGVVGITSAVILRSKWMPKQSSRGLRSPKSQNGLRQEAIIVLGADTQLGQSLCHYLSTQGFIVVASVASEQSMQVFDSLIPPSSRGYIKPIILDSSEPRAEDINYFVRSAAAAKELRWPLTSAGDPYSRPGAEVEFAGLINALSYKSLGDSSSTSLAMHVDHITSDLNQRVVTPLATIKALIPLLANGAASTTSFVISLISSDSDVSNQALFAGMKRLERELSEEVSTTRKRGTPSATSTRSRKVLLTTVETQPSSMQSLFVSLLPSQIGGAAPRVSRRQDEVTPPLTSSGRVSIDTRGNPVEKQSRPRNMTRSSTSSEVKLQREAEYRAIFEAVMGIVLLPHNTTWLRSRYSVRLPASASLPSANKRTGEVQEQRGLERTILLEAVRMSSIPLVLLGSAFNRMRVVSRYWWPSWTQSHCYYPGNRTSANSRPAFGPGPGPASNTHSRSCIREQPSNNSKSGSSRRPASAHSTSSSEATRSTEYSGVGQSNSGPDSLASAPPSNNGMSSSGLLSSVPSSAFGDVSDHEQFDFEGGTDSPIQGVGPWESPVPSDTDSDTALGPRPQDYQTERVEEQTPHASQIVEGGNESMQSNSTTGVGIGSAGDESWMNQPRSQTDSQTLINPSSSSDQSQLGQSWVQLGSSQLQDGPK